MDVVCHSDGWALAEFVGEGLEHLCHVSCFTFTRQR